MKQVNKIKAIQVQLLFLSFLLCCLLVYPKFYHRIQADERIEIYSINDLNNIRSCLSCDYILMNDLDLTYDTNDLNGLLYHDGLGWDPIGTFNNPFEGSFDGNGYKIIGLTINRSQNYVGLFSRIARTTNRDKKIENLVLEDVSVSGNDYVGAIAGNIEYAEVDRISISGSVEGRLYVGGVTGYSYFTLVNRIYSEANIIGLSTGVGGIIGRLGRSSLVRDVHVEGTVMGTACQDSLSINCSVGGIVGRDESASHGIFSSFFNGKLIHQVSPEFWINPLKYARPILGLSYGGLVENNYHTYENTHYNNGFVHHDNILETDSFDGFDFNETWMISGRPILVDITRFEEAVALMIGIEILEFPHIVDYEYDDVLNLEGLVVIARYDDETTRQIEDYIVIGSPTILGEVEVSIVYQEFKTSFVIQVKEVSKFQLSANITGFGGQLELYCEGKKLFLPIEVVSCEIEMGVLLESMGRVLRFDLNQSQVENTTFQMNQDTLIDIEFFLLGDLNQDQIIDQHDYEAMLDELHSQEYEALHVLDVNEDGEFNLADFVFLRRVVLTEDNK